MTAVGMTCPQLRRNECTIGGAAVRLRRAQAAMLSTLLVAGPHGWVCLETLTEALWPDPFAEPDTSDLIVRIYISQLRKLGVGIETKFYRGRGAIARFNGWRIPVEARTTVVAAPRERLAA